MLSPIQNTWIGCSNKEEKCQNHTEVAIERIFLVMDPASTSLRNFRCRYPLMHIELFEDIPESIQEFQRIENRISKSTT